MPQRQYEVLPGPHGSRLKINTRGSLVLSNPRTNRGTAFTREEREKLGLVGLLPDSVIPLEGQLHRTYQRFRKADNNLSKFRYLQGLRERNTVLFYRLIAEHLEEIMPIVYTPTIGEAIQEFSLWYQHIIAVFLSIESEDRIEDSLRSMGRSHDDIDIIIVTDSEGILGIGDQGVGGVQITLGKKSLYTAAAGVDPDRMLAVVLDVGTDNLRLLNDDLYLGLRRARVRGPRYDAFIAQFVEVAQRLFPHAMIHWEDFGAGNAHRILETYRDKICTFNDDVQGTAAVVASAVISGVQSKGEKLSDQRFVIHGAGTAGIGIADLLVDLIVQEGKLDADQARSLFWATASKGLITDDPALRFRDFQRPYARPKAEVDNWGVGSMAQLDDVVRHTYPTVLIGTSGQPGAFTEAIVRHMGTHVDRPIVMPLSNPTRLAEATPADVLNWTDGRALIATGSPFPALRWGEVTYTIAQANNALVFPGLGLGVAVCRARRVTNSMIAAAALTVANLAEGAKLGDSLLPNIGDLRQVSASVAIAVAQAAAQEGVAEKPLTTPIQQVYEAMWQPVYPELVIED